MTVVINEVPNIGASLGDGVESVLKTVVAEGLCGYLQYPTLRALRS